MQITCSTIMLLHHMLHPHTLHPHAPAPVTWTPLQRALGSQPLPCPPGGLQRRPHLGGRERRRLCPQGCLCSAGLRRGEATQPVPPHRPPGRERPPSGARVATQGQWCEHSRQRNVWSAWPHPRSEPGLVPQAWHQPLPSDGHSGGSGSVRSLHSLLVPILSELFLRKAK